MSRKLLIVDDSNMMRMAIERYSGGLGFTIVGTAANGKIAVELFAEHHPDFVTLDITMPEMDGLAVLDEILKIKPDAKVLIISALSEKSIAVSALTKGAKAFLQKPFNETTIRAALSELIGE